MTRSLIYRDKGDEGDRPNPIISGVTPSVKSFDLSLSSPSSLLNKKV
jgi:hypothetical protein